MRFLIGALLVVMMSLDGVCQSNDPHSAIVIAPGCRNFLSDRQNFTNQEVFDQGKCSGIIRGLNFLDTHSCPPKEVTLEQMVRVVVQYIDNLPARHREDFRQLAMEAFITAWPCQRGSARRTHKRN